MKVQQLWDGQGAVSSEMWNGKNFRSFISNCGYISRFADKNDNSIQLPNAVDYTGEPCGEEYGTPFAEGEEFNITTDSGSMVIVDRVKVVEKKLLVLSTQQVLQYEH